METPYMIGLLFLFGVRMFVKIFQGMVDGPVQQMVVVGDAILLSICLQAGVVPQFARQTDADVCTLAFLFSCISFARGVVHMQDTAQKSVKGKDE
jgi:hypothetical protein